MNNLATEKQRDFIRSLLVALYLKKKITLYALNEVVEKIDNVKQKFFGKTLTKKEASTIISGLIEIGNVPEKGTKEWEKFCAPVYFSSNLIRKIENGVYNTYGKEDLAKALIYTHIVNAYNNMVIIKQQQSDLREYGDH